ncbi:AI-2E family transporter [Mangrovimonas aestuarii]|uniref:AI-2E family transporter n=1 Tax=Mangrovimonas aestuarii TaxID=3018443 RepID=UPI00237906FB|nr:AI-2E family transporter [Mangrovimonas aestuarii]
MDQRRTTNLLLLIIVIPLVFYILKLLSFIFIPLVSSMFIALLFLPLMRWFNKRKVPKYISIAIVVLIIALAFRVGGELIQLSSKEIMSADGGLFLEKAKIKIALIKDWSRDVLGISFDAEGSILSQLVNKDNAFANFKTTFGALSGFLTSILMTAFFVVLWLGESINVQKLMNATLLKGKHASVKTFRKIEKDLVKFIKVKFLVSLLTGIGISVACWYFDVSFPIFWGLFAFLINFVQMVGSFISVILVAIFAIVEMQTGGQWLLFVLACTGVQVLFGAILEPVFMGKSFAINVITVLVMLMLWGFIWGVPGLIMAIPITVFMKIILEQFPSTKIIADLVSGAKE